MPRPILIAGIYKIVEHSTGGRGCGLHGALPGIVCCGNPAGQCLIVILRHSAVISNPGDAAEKCSPFVFPSVGLAPALLLSIWIFLADLP